MATIPDWMIQKTKIQAQKTADKIAYGTIAPNRPMVIEHWDRHLSQYAAQVDVTVRELLKASGLDRYENGLPPPTPRSR